MTVRLFVTAFVLMCIAACGPGAMDSQENEDLLTSDCQATIITNVSASTNDGNLPSNVLDGKLSTRWSGSGIGAYITADLGTSTSVCGVGVAWYLGNQRTNNFVISTSLDGSTFNQAYTGKSTGKTTAVETYTITPGQSRYVRVTVNGNSQNLWASITELQVYASASKPTTDPAPVNNGSYDTTILTDHPVAFWGVNHTNGAEPDLTGNGNNGTYQGGTPPIVTMPNGDQAADFNGSSEYLTIPSNASMSIPTTGNLTWEGWIRPDVLQFPHSTGGYVDWMGKCANYSPTCEWEARMYNASNSQNRYNRLSAYVFNPSAGLGSGADWQPVQGLLQANQWYYVVGEYTTLSQPSTCSNASTYPGSINIWVNGVKWSQPNHNPTGCMSQYNVVPKTNNSPVNIGKMASDSYFQGAVGKVAIYNYLLSQAQITNHFYTMTGELPSGSCANTCVLQ